MGGSQSAQSTLFSYECNCYVAEFMKSKTEYFLELRLAVQEYATCESITIEAGVGKIKLQAKLGLPSTAIQECKQKLDDYFQGYMTFAETLNSASNLSSYDVSSYITDNGLRCQAKWDYLKQEIRITGISADVKAMVRLIRNAQMPKPAPPPRPTALSTLVTAHQSQPVASVSSPPLIQPAPSSPVSTFSGFAIVSTDTASSSKASGVTQHVSPSNDYGFYPNPSVHVQRPVAARRTRGSRPAMQKSADERLLEELSKNVYQCLSTKFRYTYPAPDFSVARFIKYSKAHSLSLTEAMKLFSIPVVWQNKEDKKMEYRCRPVEDLFLMAEDFERVCKEHLDQFLEKYFSLRKRFNPDRMQKAVAKEPQFFADRTREQNEDIFLQWHVNDNIVIIAGLKEDVQRKEKEIVDFLDELVPRCLPTRMQFHIPAQNFSVALFIKQSNSHKSALKEHFKSIATVVIWRGDKKTEYQFRLIPDLSISKQEFESSCQSLLTQFLDNYSSKKRYFNHEHLMKVALKEPAFFNKQTSEENEVLFVEWHLNENKVIIAGLKMDVENKEKEIVNFLDTTAPRTLRNAYEFTMDSLNISATRFIKESTKHMERLKEVVENDAKVWITPGKHAVHFKAIVELSQRDIPAFEEKCRIAVQSVISQYCFWKRSFPRAAVARATEHNLELFAEDDDSKVFIYHDVEIFIVGLKQRVDQRKAAVMALMKRYTPEKFNPSRQGDGERPPSRGGSLGGSRASSVSDLSSAVASPKKLGPYIYDPRGRASKDVIKHVFQSPIDLAAMRHSIGNFVQFEVYPNVENPHGVRFVRHPDVKDDEIFREHFLHQVPNAVNEFFGRFTVTSKQCQKHEIPQVIDTVNKTGMRFRVGEKMLSIHIQDNTVKVVGQKEIANEIARQINGKIEEVQKSFNLPPSGQNTSRRCSASSTTSETSNQSKRSEKGKSPGGKKNKNPPASGKPTPKTKQEPAWRESYTPKQAYRERFSIVLQDKSLRDQLKSRCTDLCEFEGTDLPIALIPLNNNLNRPTFTKEVVKRIENFLDTMLPQQQISMQYVPKKAYFERFSIVLANPVLYGTLKSQCIDLCQFDGIAPHVTITPTDANKTVDRSFFTKEVVKRIETFLDSVISVSVPLDGPVMEFFAQNKDAWLAEHFVSTDCVILDWQTDGLKISGVTDAVTKYKELVEKELEVVNEEKTWPQDVCRVLVACDVLVELNTELSGTVKVACSPGEGLVSFNGRRCFIPHAFTKLAELGKLVERAPNLSKIKLKILQKLFSEDDSVSNQTFVNDKLLEHNVKGLIVWRDGNVILATRNTELFNRGCEVLDDLVESKSVVKPNGLPLNLFEKSEWMSLIKSATASKRIFVQIQDRCVHVTGLEKKAVQEAAERIKKFMQVSLTATSNVRCDEPHVKKFIMKYYSPGNTGVSGVSLIDTQIGINITGPRANVDRMVQILTSMKWRSSKLPFSSPGLSSYLTTHLWQDFTKLLENEVRCTLFCDVTKNEKPVEEMNEVIPSSSSRSHRAFSSDSGKTTTYGSVKVTVCQGDITADDSDAIINGVTRDFDLSRGTVSSALLNRAGSKMQDDCIGAATAGTSTPYIRVTNGWNLLCDHVIHLVTPHKAEDMTKRVKEALDHAEMFKAQSVALPTLGAGAIGLSATDVSCRMSEAFELFARENPLCVKAIKVVVFDYSILDVFQMNIIESKEMLSFGKREASLAESKAKSSLIVDEVLVCVNADNEESLNEAKNKIEQHMSHHLCTKEIKDDVISSLDDHDRIDLYEAAVKFEANLKFNLNSAAITLDGLKENVGKLYDFTRELLFELKEARTLAKMSVWKWSTTANTFAALPLRVSRAIEIEYEKKKTGSSFVMLYGTYLTIDFSKMTYDFKTISGRLQRLDSIKEMVPSDWCDMMSKPWIKVSLPSSSPEYAKVVTRFLQSKPEFTRIIDIERIQHPSLYKLYMINKSDVEKHMTSDNPVERELFHGTSQVDAGKICAHGFDRNFAGKNATVYGKGTYFAVNSSYSTNYAQKNPLDVQCIFLSRVLTGDFCKGHHDFRAPPQKPQSGDVPPRLYDSVVDDESEPTIFVVFKDSSVYPSYLIKFQ